MESIHRCGFVDVVRNQGMNRRLGLCGGRCRHGERTYGCCSLLVATVRGAGVGALSGGEVSAENDRDGHAELLDDPSCSAYVPRRHPHALRDRLMRRRDPAARARVSGARIVTGDDQERVDLHLPGAQLDAGRGLQALL